MSFKEIIDKHENTPLKPYPNGFATYQDMIDAGHFIMEYSDNEENEKEDVDDDDDDDSLPELIDIKKVLDEDFESLDNNNNDEVKSELSEEEDIKTISLIEEVFKHSKKVSAYNRKLREEMEELRDVVNDMGILIKFSVVFFGIVFVFLNQSVRM
jgi:hypothetical protein